MRKTLVTALALLSCVSMLACGGSKASDTEKPTDTKIPGMTDVKKTPAKEAFAIPDYVASYKAPTSGSTETFDMVLEVEGDYYKLPCPVSEFLKNDFTLLDTYQDVVVSAQTSAKIRFRLGNESIEAKVFNYATYDTVVQNCFVTEFYADSFMNSAKLSILGKIEVGDSVSEVEEVLEGQEYSKEITHENTDYSSTVYTLQKVNGGAGVQYFYISADEEGFVTTVKAVQEVMTWDGTGEATDKKASSTVVTVPESSIYSFHVSVNGETIHVPVAFADLANNGWNFVEDGVGDEMLEAAGESSSERVKKGEIEILVALTNTTSGKQKKSDCVVTGITLGKYNSIAYYDWDTFDGEIALPQGLLLMKAKRSDVLAAYGVPSDEAITEELYIMKYSLHDGRIVELWLDSETEELKHIQMTNKKKD